MVAANYIYNVAKPDGLTFGLVTPALYIEQLMGRKEVQFDWPKYSYLGSPEQTARIFYIRADSGYQTIEDMRKVAEPPKCGATGVGTASYYWPNTFFTRAMTPGGWLIIFSANFCSSSPLTGSTSIFPFLASSKSCGSAIALACASRNIFTRSFRVPGGTTQGRPKSVPRKITSATRRLSSGVFSFSKIS